jgi:hypothetical protein
VSESADSACAVVQIIDDFEHKHGRVPLFWLDKVCIDQTKITESLRALPIFLVSCKRMLIIAGPTYINRLWYVILPRAQCCCVYARRSHWMCGCVQVHLGVAHAVCECWWQQGPSGRY